MIAEVDIPGLHYGSDQEPGIRRVGTKRFRYIDQRTGRPATPADLDRIARLVIPPAWTDVWIAPSPDSHVQATGRDARGRKQYRYHERFTAHRAEHKFADLVGFGEHLGALRRRVRRDLHADDLGHDQVVAVVVRLLDITGLRVGNDEYARTNQTYGLTTLRDQHVSVRGSTVHLNFKGKVAKEFDVRLDDRLMARLVRRCQDLPGQALFAYRTPDGGQRTVTSNDVNRYLSTHGSPVATAKTFRTWNATVGAASGLVEVARDEEQPSQRTLVGIIDQVAEALGNTRTVCRNSYIHPAVIEAYVDNRLVKAWNRPTGKRPAGLSNNERRTLRLIRLSGRTPANRARTP
jgi:DNA topoisomerase-1